MKKLSISKGDFDVILYPLVATTPCDGPSELGKVIRILEQLEARSTPVTDPDVDDAVGVPTLYELTDERAVFRFEDDLAVIVANRIEGGIKMLAPMRARVIPGLTAQLREDSIPEIPLEEIDPSVDFPPGETDPPIDPDAGDA